jgi:hypothetical protein
MTAFQRPVGGNMGPPACPDIDRRIKLSQGRRRVQHEADFASDGFRPLKSAFTAK